MRRVACINVCLALLVALASARSADTNSPSNSIDEETAARSASGNNGIFGDLRYVYQVYKECSSNELSTCLKLKLLTAMDRVARSVQVDIADGVTLEKDINNLTDNNQEAPRSVQEIKATLPRSLDDREDTLNSMIFEKIVNFFQTHTLKLKLTNVEELQRSLTEEGKFQKSLFQQTKKTNIFLNLIVFFCLLFFSRNRTQEEGQQNGTFGHSAVDWWNSGAAGPRRFGAVGR